MSPAELAEYIAVLRAGRVLEAKIPVVGASHPLTLTLVPDEPALEPMGPPGAKFIDEKGKAIDLDDGLPDLARDPIAEAYFPPSKGD